MGINSGLIEILAYLPDNIDAYIALCVLVSGIYFFCIKRIFWDFFDPFIIQVAGAIFATSTIFFMYYMDLIQDDVYFYDFIYTEVAFWMGFLLVSKKNIKFCEIRNVKYDATFDDRKTTIYAVYITLFFLFSIISILQNGVGLAAENHVKAAATGGVLNIMSHYFLVVVIPFLYDRFYSGHKIESIILGFGIFLILASGGSKGFALSFATGLFFYRMYRFLHGMEDINYKRIYINLFFLAVTGAISTLLYYNIYDGFEGAMIQLGQRLVGYGDGFAYAYGAGGIVIQQLINNNDIFSLIAPILSFLKIVPLPDHYDAVGNQMVNLVYGIADSSSGPNLRHNIFELLGFGYFGGGIFAFCMGCLIGGVIRKLIEKVQFNIYCFIFFIGIYTSACSYLTDPILALEGMLRGLIVNVALLTAIHLFSRIR